MCTWYEWFSTEVRKLASELHGHALLLRVNPEVARALAAGINMLDPDVGVAGTEVSLPK